MTAFADLQRRIERLYALPTMPAVEDFLVSTDEQRAIDPALDDAPRLLIREADGELRLAVHLGDALRARLSGAEPAALALDDLCAAIEEISHFLYLSFCAGRDREVSLLDLELQAEIDKFMLARALRPDDEGLFARLFERVGYRDGMDAAADARYREANRLGAKFVARVAPGLAPEPEGPVARFLAEFYRTRSARRLCKVNLL